MNLLIIGLKIALLLSWYLTVSGVMKLYCEDTGVHMKFDWVSWLNISGTVGVSLVALLAVIDKTTYTFTACLIFIAIALVWFLKARLMIAGDHKALLGSKMIDQSEICKVYARFLTLYVETKSGMIKLYGPVTERSVTMQLYDAAVGKRRK
ncbi:MAG: hypothetical protein K6A40_05170 [Solobacterium sp.]|nr:hypothetical protein [Solobacterium sp.]